MAHKIIWSRQARDDLREIVEFIAAERPAVAESFCFRLMSKVDVLAKFPLLGRVVPEEHNENLREIILRPYRIIYEILPAQQVVAVARIWHGARGETELESRLEL